MDEVFGYGLKPVELDDRAIFELYFSSLSEPLSDYTFSQLYTWRNSLRILWKQLNGHLCVFANGTGDLTLLVPPIGDTGSDKALFSAYEIMDDYNFHHGVFDHSCVEYISEEMLNRFDISNVQVKPMGADYLYDVNCMINLTGGDLASKRQSKNRFMRNYVYRVEFYSSILHQKDCLYLLENWKDYQDVHHDNELNTNSIKRSKEFIATKLAIENAEILGLNGIVVYVKIEDKWILKGFTFGETLGKNQSSIIIEKTDLTIKGLAQFIFSEFCRVNWADRPLVNVGDDWGLETLAWTKQSYRPVKMLQKYVLKRK